MNTRLLAVVLLLSLTAVVLGATVFREQVAAAAPGIQDVFVTNSTREPVPVHEQGTADVNVTNAPLAVHEQGTANVNVTNAPLAVRASGEQPVQWKLEWEFGLGECIAFDSYTVPAGKYLRIEQVTLRSTDDIELFRVSTNLLTDNGTTAHFLEFRRAQPVRIYAEPEEGVGFAVALKPKPLGCGPLQYAGSFSGVLIDAP